MKYLVRVEAEWLVEVDNVEDEIEAEEIAIEIIESSMFAQLPETVDAFTLAEQDDDE